MNAASPAPPSHLSILVAEDNEYDRMILQHAFDELGLNIHLFFVTNGEDVLDYLSVGASAVQVGTANFADPAVTQRLVEGLREAVYDAKAFTIKDIVSDFHAEIG